jgi:hypothetical protein
MVPITLYSLPKEMTKRFPAILICNKKILWSIQEIARNICVVTQIGPFPQHRIENGSLAYA